MMKYKKFAVIALSAVTVMSSLTGCSLFNQGNLEESVARAEAESEAAKGPDMEIHDNITLDFSAAQDECDVLLKDEGYDLSSYIDTYVDEDSKTVTLIWPLKDEATEEDGLVYANAIVRAFNDACQEQDFSIKLSSEDYYGGLYEKYAFNVQVFKESSIMDAEHYFVSMTVDAGSQEPLVLFSQYTGQNLVELGNGQELINGGRYGQTEAETTAEAETTEAAETEPVVGPGAALQKK